MDIISKYYFSTRHQANILNLKRKIHKQKGIPASDYSKCEQEMRKMASDGVGYIEFGNENYPDLLGETTDAPIFLSYKGNLDLLDNSDKLVSIVGTRKNSDYGKALVDTFLDRVKNLGMSTVSGMARGIDALVHELSIKKGIPTIAVIPSGIGKIYPQVNYRLAKKIIESGGLIISEDGYYSLPYKWSFIKRNRIIAGLSRYTLVVEAAEKSGSLHTADFAFNENREVLTFCGNIFNRNFAGNHKIIRENKGQLLTHPNEFLKDQQLSFVDNTTQSVNREFKKILKALQNGADDVDSIVELSQLTPKEVLKNLNKMEQSELIIVGTNKIILK